MTEDALRQHGYRRVASDAEAYQLIRLWLKLKAKDQQRGWPQPCLQDPLAIKPGAWVKVGRYSCGTFRQRRRILLWRGAVAESE